MCQSWPMMGRGARPHFVWPCVRCEAWQANLVLLPGKESNPLGLWFKWVKASGVRMERPITARLDGDCAHMNKRPKMSAKLWVT